MMTIQKEFHCCIVIILSQLEEIQPISGSRVPQKQLTVNDLLVGVTYISNVPPVPPHATNCHNPSQTRPRGHQDAPY